MHGDKKETMEDAIAVELPLTFVIDGEEFATMVCSPTHVEELAIGFLASEGLIRTMEDLADLQLDLRRGFIYVELRVTSSIHKDQVNKRFIGSCCGKSRQFYFHNDMRTAKTIMSDHKLEAKRCWLMMHELEDASSSFKRTGGMHNAALFNHERLLVARTDIGRHNALDKLFGYCLQQRLPVNDKILAFSGQRFLRGVVKGGQNRYRYRVVEVSTDFTSIGACYRSWDHGRRIHTSRLDECVYAFAKNSV